MRQKRRAFFALVHSSVSSAGVGGGIRQAMGRPSSSNTVPLALCEIMA